MSQNSAAVKIVEERYHMLIECPHMDNFLINDNLDSNILQLGENEPNKTLGILWNAQADTIQYAIKNVNLPSKVTKRYILSVTAQIFDPLGLLGPVVIVAKIILQLLWQEKISWAEPLPNNILKKWNAFCTDLPLLNELTIPRHIGILHANNFELHAFADASQIAYGACLCAALLLAQLVEKVRTRGPPSKWKTFIGNRVSEIQQLTNIEDWHHVSSNNNCADLISRGVNSRQLLQSKLWWQGPSFLEGHNLSWNLNDDFTNESIVVPEMRIITNLVIDDYEDFEIFSRYSSLVKLQRVIAYCYRFIHNSKNKRENRYIGPLTVYFANRTQFSKRKEKLLVKISTTATVSATLLATMATRKLHLFTSFCQREFSNRFCLSVYSASTSNLNHDIGVDGKSEFSCTSNAINEAWIPLISPQNNYADSDRFSNGECPDDVNGYSELQDNPNILSSNTSKYRSEIHPRGDYSPSEFDRLQNLYPTSQRNVKSSYVATSSCIREPRTNSEEDDRTKVQKQLQLIKSVCDSMLEEQTANISPNVQHMQNNLIPSYFSEPHRFILPNQHTLNTLNFINSTDISNYQNWLATNTIQTQSFMLNTLNQCCQMLWLQQRELTSLKTAVTMLQERVENIPFGGAQERIPSSLHTTPQDHRVGSHYRPVPNPKVNQVSSAFSLPNLNNYNVPSSNLELNYNQNNIHGGRLLDPSLNNINVNHLNPHQGIEHANNLLHGVNSNINTVPNQMWNGQALNNQVTPGNRSNNYWANFRRRALPAKLDEDKQNMAKLKVENKILP
ncbi:hypothetical protein NQ317_010233 [Molorchus minor]|uniref:Uncharacterized protein n=1 Tax=Molorchus minor TaxID=1323400 RepID=A0ABQ9JHC8_9CUCU|nr:hypothetical protein NQ317_010233 [Molorchus minor]